MLYESYKKLHQSQVWFWVWADWNFGFMSQLKRSLALYKEMIFKSLFKKKYVHGKYLSYAKLGRYVAYLGTEALRFP